MANEADQLIAVTAKIIDVRNGARRISPSWVATEAMIELDPGKISPPQVYLGCHLHLRQIARGILAARFEEGGDDSAQNELFPDLQKRYPIVRCKRQEPEYELLEHLTNDDIAYNVTRLRREAAAKLKHADALEAYGRSRQAA